VQTGFFERKTIPWRSLIDLAAVYVGYIVLGNLSIKLNPVGFYQIVKALIQLDAAFGSCQLDAACAQPRGAKPVQSMQSCVHRPCHPARSA
jgi:hypothetical protein